AASLAGTTPPAAALPPSASPHPAPPAPAPLLAQTPSDSSTSAPSRPPFVGTENLGGDTSIRVSRGHYQPRTTAEGPHRTAEAGPARSRRPAFTFPALGGPPSRSARNQTRPRRRPREVARLPLAYSASSPGRPPSRSRSRASRVISATCCSKVRWVVS